MCVLREVRGCLPSDSVAALISLIMLYPIRMDVSLQASSSSQIASVRVIDTVLVDPHVCSASQIAYEAMADAQVLPVTRHATGRVEYDLARAWREATTQVEDQLRTIRELEKKQAKANYDNAQAFLTQNAKKRARPDDQAQDVIETKKLKTESGTSVVGSATLSSTNEVANNDLISVHLRISINGTRIHDDFQWDPSLKDFTPLQMAESIAEDLLLPTDTIPAMAICIAEQVYQPLSSTSKPKDDDTPVTNDATTAAWKITTNSRS